MAFHNMPDADYLRQCFHYNPETGLLRWRTKHGARGVAGAIAGSPERKGYQRVWLDGRRHYAHRIAWVMMVGLPPCVLVDHKNGDKTDNRWENLRLATHQENQWNKKVYGKRSDLPKGVSYNKKRAKPYRAQIVLGSFGTAEEAERAYLAAAARLHGSFFWSS